MDLDGVGKAIFRGAAQRSQVGCAFGPACDYGDEGDGNGCCDGRISLAVSERLFPRTLCALHFSQNPPTYAFRSSTAAAVAASSHWHKSAIRVKLDLVFVFQRGQQDARVLVPRHEVIQHLD